MSTEREPTEEEMLAELDQLLERPSLKPDPSYLAKMELAYANRVSYPYEWAKADLGEFIELWKRGAANSEEFDRLTSLSRKLIKHGIIPDEIGNHAKKLADERTNGPRVPEVLDFTEHRALDVLESENGKGGGETGS